MEKAIECKRFARFEEFMALMHVSIIKQRNWTKCARYSGNSGKENKGMGGKSRRNGSGKFWGHFGQMKL
jgi:hypothetical protein